MTSTQIQASIAAGQFPRGFRKRECRQLKDLYDKGQINQAVAGYLKVEARQNQQRKKGQPTTL